MLHARTWVGVLCSALFFAASSASAATIVLSTVSSDATPASQFDAVLEFEVGDFDLGNAGDELRLTLTNPSALEGGDALFNINEVYWNAVVGVSETSRIERPGSIVSRRASYWAPA